MLDNLFIIFITGQTILIPVLGVLFLAIRQERQRKERLLDESLRMFNLLRIHTGRRRW